MHNTKLIITIISLIHIAVIMYYILAPFLITSRNQMEMYICLSIFLLFHWAFNDNTCFLTILESQLTNKKSHDTFIGQIVNPIFRINNTMIIIITYCLLLFTLHKYYLKIY
jgi:hypothetical protein